jgi:hypothetical protein
MNIHVHTFLMHIHVPNNVCLHLFFLVLKKNFVFLFSLFAYFKLSALTHQNIQLCFSPNLYMKYKLPVVKTIIDCWFALLRSTGIYRNSHSKWTCSKRKSYNLFFASSSFFFLNGYRNLLTAKVGIGYDAQITGILYFSLCT